MREHPVDGAHTRARAGSPPPTPGTPAPGGRPSGGSAIKGEGSLGNNTNVIVGICRRLLMAILLLAPGGLTCCSAQSQATKVDDRTFKIEGPGVPGGAEAPNRRLAERVCPGGYRVLDSQRFKTGSGGFGDPADVHTNWTIRCL